MRRSYVVVFANQLALVLMGGSAIAQAQSETPPDWDAIFEDPVNRALGQQAFDDTWVYMSDSKIPWIRAAAALHFIRKSDFLPDTDPALRAEGAQLAAEIIAGEPRDAHALWLLLDACHSAPEISGCASSTLGDRLIEAEPDNAAAYLKAAGVIVDWMVGEVEDSKEARQALVRAANAKYFDAYYGRDAVQLYQSLKTFEESYNPTHEPAVDLPAYARAGGKVWTVFSLMPMTGFGGVSQLCEAQVHAARADHVDACLTLARTMQSAGKSLISQTLGYYLERKVMEAMGADPSITLYLYRKSRMAVHVRSCQTPSWMRSGDAWPDLDEATVAEYFSDLESLGEVGAIRNRATREYKVNPEAYEHDPEACEALMELDSESMGLVLGNADPKSTMDSRSAR